MIPRLVFLDLEGTLIRIPKRISHSGAYPSMWAMLAELLGPDCYRDELAITQKFRDGRMNYLDFMDETISIFQAHGLNYDVYKELLKLVRPEPGIQTVAETLRRHGAILVIITGALKGIAEPIQQAMEVRHLFAGAELYFDKQTGELKNWNLLPSDFEGKVDFMRLLIREYSCSSKDCVFIGDGINDIPLAKEVGISIAYNSSSDALKEICTYSINRHTSKRNFLDVLEVLAINP